MLKGCEHRPQNRVETRSPVLFGWIAAMLSEGARSTSCCIHSPRCTLVPRHNLPELLAQCSLEQCQPPRQGWRIQLWLVHYKDPSPPLEHN